MPARNRRFLAALAAAAAAILIGVAFGYQPSTIGIHPAPTSTTASTRVPLGLRQGPTSAPAASIGNPPQFPTAASTPTGGMRRGRGGRAAVTTGQQAAVTATGPASSVARESSTTAQPPTSIAPPSTTTAPTTVPEPTTTVVNGTIDSVVS